MESRETRLRRLKIRSMRRGTREMDLILGGFADSLLDTLGGPDLHDYEKLLEESDQDLYLWMSGQADPPQGFGRIMGIVKSSLRG